MKYHATVQFGFSAHQYWDFAKEDLLSHIVIPYISKQTTLSKTQRGRALLSFGTASYLTIAKTTEQLEKEIGRRPEQLDQDPFWAENNCTEEILQEVRLATTYTPFVRSLIERVFSPLKPQAFIISRFGDPALDSAYARVLVPVCDSFGLTAFRVDKVQDSQVITEQILDNIASSQLVIAELSGDRPNCYYETGFAQALGKEVILLIREGEKIHFDLHSNRFIVWSSELDLQVKLNERLSAVSARREAAATKSAI